MKFRSLLCSCLALPLAMTGLVLAGPVGVQLVADIDAETGGRSSDPQRFVRIGDAVYFAATEPETGMELYVSEAGAAAPRLVVDLARGTGSSSPTALGRRGDRLLLSGDDGLRGMQLWSLDLVSGERTRLTSETWSPDGGPFATARGEFGASVLYELGSARRLWLSDGTPQGTRVLDAGDFGAGWPAPLCVLGDTIVRMRPATFSSDFDIVATDGTASGTRVLARADGLFYPRAFADGGACYFVSQGHGGSGWKVWRSDGSIAGTQLLGSSNSTSLRDSAVLGGQVYLLETSWQAPSQLRLRRVGHDEPLIQLPENPSYTASLRVAGNRLVFLGPLNNDTSLFVSDGTATGTHAVAQPAEIATLATATLHAPGTRHVAAWTVSGPWMFDMDTEGWTPLGGAAFRLRDGDFAVRNGIFHFAGTDARGTEVWRSDGSAAGTQLLHDVWAASRDGIAGFGTVAAAATADGSALLFAPYREYGVPDYWVRRLWRTDGSAAGTYRLDTAAYSGGSVEELAAFGQGALFATVSVGPSSPRRLYATDAGLSFASPIAANVGYLGLFPIRPGGGVLLHCPGAGGNAICAVMPGDTQATPVLTALPADSQFVPLASYGGGALFFIQDFGSSVRGFWHSDGTTPGTYRVAADLRPIDSLSMATLNHGGSLVFGACGAVAGSCGLHLTDGSAAGTRRILAFDGEVAGLAPLAGRIAVLRQTSGTQLMLVDTTGAPAQIVRTLDASNATAFAAASERVHFIVQSATGATDYYVSDGTTAGTQVVAMPVGVRPLLVDPIALDADTVVFHCTSPATGRELCAANAAATQVRVIRDFFPGAGDSAPAWHGRLANGLYFSLDDGRHGRELWRVFAQSDLIFAHGFGQDAKP